uniref:endonuclease/exonuclease/phosphatase family protein n=1 Tax=uncultured Draconibacterium sp. TaxID=1573823 RepID=UPI003216DB13
MKINILKIVFVFCLGVLCSGNIFGQNDTLKIMSYNLRFGELASMEQIGSYIKNEAPDVVLLQELDWKTYRKRAPKQHGVPMINVLASATEMFGIFGKAIDYADGYYGIGILSKYPIISSKRIFLPNPPPEKEQRVMLEVQIELAGKNVVTVLCTHLEVSSAEKRQAQIDFINSYTESIKTPVILGGDFNDTPESKEIAEGLSKWSHVSCNNYTYHTQNPTKKIDHICVYPKEAFKALEMQIGKSVFSDHLPVISNLIIYNSIKF